MDSFGFSLGENNHNGQSRTAGVDVWSLSGLRAGEEGVPLFSGCELSDTRQIG